MDENTAAPEDVADLDTLGSGSSVLDPAVRRLSDAVDDLSGLSSQPVDEHADRYREVHNVLQDALSDTDRGGPQPS